MTDDQSSPSEDDFARRYVEVCVGKWIDRRLPVSALAAAMIAWGLQASSYAAGVEGTAEGLERLAAAVRETAKTDPDAPSR